MDYSSAKYTMMICLCRMLRICYNFVRGADRMKEELFDDLILAYVSCFVNIFDYFIHSSLF